MKKLFLVLPAFVLFMSCGGESSTDETTGTTQDAPKEESFSTANDPVPGSNRALMIGSWSNDSHTLEVTKTQFTLSDSAKTIIDSDYQLSYKDDNTDLNDQIDHGHKIHLMGEGKVASFTILTESDFKFSVDMDGGSQTFQLSK